MSFSEGEKPKLRRRIFGFPFLVPFHGERQTKRMQPARETQSVHLPLVGEPLTPEPFPRLIVGRRRYAMPAILFAPCPTSQIPCSPLFSLISEGEGAGRVIFFFIDVLKEGQGGGIPIPVLSEMDDSHLYVFASGSPPPLLRRFGVVQGIALWNGSFLAGKEETDCNCGYLRHRVLHRKGDKRF